MNIKHIQKDADAGAAILRLDDYNFSIRRRDRVRTFGRLAVGIAKEIEAE